MISIVVPTVKGREKFLAECLAAYKATTEDYQVHVVSDRPTCGRAWLDGAELAKGDYIHFSADDLLPHAGWWQAAEKVVSCGYIPAPRILNAEGKLETCGGNDGFKEQQTGHVTDFTRIPFVSAWQWNLIKPAVERFLTDAHYFTDNAISWAALRENIATVVHRGYQFTHRWAQAGRGAGMTEPERMKHDFDAFVAHAKAAA